MTKASTRAKAKYNNKTYTEFRAMLPKDEYASIDDYCKQHNMSKASFIRKGWEYIKEKEKLS